MRELKGVDFPSAKPSLICNLALLETCSVMMAMLALLTVDGQHGSTVYAGFSAFAEATVQSHFHIAQSLIFLENNTVAELGPWTRGTTAVIIATAAWWTLMLWTISYVTTFLMGAHLLAPSETIRSAHGEPGLDNDAVVCKLRTRPKFPKVCLSGRLTLREPLLQELRQFNKIRALIETYNEALHFFEKVQLLKDL